MRPLIAFSLLVAISGCNIASESDSDTAESSATSALRAPTSGRPGAPVTASFAACDSSRLPIAVTALGSTLTLEGPPGARLDSRIDQIGDTWPVLRTSQPGSTMFTFDLSAQKPELYVRSGRLMFEAPGRFGLERTECQVSISDPRWERIEATRFFIGASPGRVTRTQDLGAFARGKGLLLSVGSNTGRGIVAVAGTPTPTRKSVASNGESVWVFDGLTRGSYAVDVDMAFPDYGTTVVHFLFRID